MISSANSVQLTPPHLWREVPFWSLFRRVKEINHPDEELLSVYRDHGVVPTASRDDNFNKPSLDLSGYQLVRKGALVTNKMKAWQGSIAISRHRGIVSPAYYVYEPLSREHDQYLHYLLRSQPFVALYQRISKGVRVNQWDLEHEALRIVPIRLPDLPTQKAIADFLDRETARIDQLIEKKQRMVEVLGERARSVNEHFFLDAEPISIQPLHRLYRVVTGKTPSRNEEDNFSDEEGFLWATPANLGFLAPIETTKEFLTAKGFEGQPIVDPGTVLLNGIGASVGKIGIAGACLSFNQQIHALNPKKRVLDDRFLFFQLLTLKEQLVLLANSTTLPILNSERLGRLELRIFDSRDQKRHCANMNAILQNEETTSRKIAASIDRLREFRSALITAAVTGQIDVSTWGKQGMTERRFDQIEEAASA